MDITSPSLQRRRIVIATAAVAAIFVLVPVIGVWLSPFNASASGNGAPPTEKSRQSTSVTPELTVPDQQLALAGYESAPNPELAAAALAADGQETAGGEGQQADTPAEPVGDGTDADAGGTGAAEEEAVGEAVTGFWKLAWQKAWPPIKNILVGLWALTKSVFVGLWNIVKDIGGSVNDSVNSAPLNLPPPPVNTSP